LAGDDLRAKHPKNLEIRLYRLHMAVGRNAEDAHVTSFHDQAPCRPRGAEASFIAKACRFSMTAMSLAVAIAIVSFVDGTAFAQQEKVVAKVNGRDITEADVRLAEAEIGNDLGSIPAEQRRRVLVEYLIENALFAEAAEADKLGGGASFDDRMKYWQRRALRDAYFDKSVKGAVSDADARKLYDAQLSAAKPQEEIRARHILVENEDKAKEVQEKIKRGDDFTQLAKDYSKDPGSKDDGGDLGYFARGQMVPQFEEAAFKLNKGDVSAPVQSQFGWHVIKLEDKRQRGAPEFDTIKDRIVASLVHRKAQEVAASLREKAKLEFVDPDLKAAVDAENQIRPAPAAEPKK
jgi:peptidyl-prolyl cis-trans isomerase C